MSRQNFKSEIIKDIYGNRWTVTKRVDSGYGFDLLYGWPPEEVDANWKRQHGVPHILDAVLEGFILSDLAGFPAMDIPITLSRKLLLRRIISSRRYKDLKDWEQNRDPNEDVFYVHEDHIKLPRLRDIEKRPYNLSGVRYFRPGFPIWMGTAIMPEKKPRGSAYVLTKGLARFLFKTAHLKGEAREKLGLPMNKVAETRLRHRAVGYFRPDMHSFKTADDKDRRRQIQLHPDYVEGAQVTDALGTLWHIRHIKQNRYGDFILRGTPANQILHPGWGVILTREIAALFDADPTRGSRLRLAERLGVDPTVIGRMRAALGEGNSHDVSDQWWADRIENILAMGPKEFSEAHDSSYEGAAAMKKAMRYILKCANGEDRGRPYIVALETHASSKDIAKYFDYKTTRTIAHHRKALRILKQANKL